MTEQTYYFTKFEDWTIKCERPIKHIFETLEEWRYTVSVKKIRNRRSADQNRYYWACLWLIAVEVGYIHDDMDLTIKGKVVDALHEIFKDRFLSSGKIKSVKDKRKSIRLPGSSKNLDTKEFSEYMNKIKTLHPYLPSPEDKNLLQFIDQYYFK